ncbi:ferruginol synthase-like, partial [Bidens hawaiensis]|uniref:ferruginol synthase-like n=1 Tax=Bidens hawaiensis TaxID=980011 RepID=UPI00404B2643
MLTSKGPNPPLPPGPRPLLLLGNLLSLDPELHSYFADVAKTYGPISRLWLGQKLTILITSPALAREVLKVNELTFADRSVSVAGIVGTFDGNDISSAPYGDQWRMLRKIFVRDMLSSHVLDSVYSIRQREVRNTVNYLYKHAGKPVDVGKQMFLTAWNMITGMIWRGTDNVEKLGAEFRDVIDEMLGYVAMPNVSDFYPALAPFDLQGIKKNMKVLVKRLDGIFDNMIEQRRKMPMGGHGIQDFLQVLLELKDAGDSNPPFTITHLKGLLM